MSNKIKIALAIILAVVSIVANSTTVRFRTNPIVPGGSIFSTEIEIFGLGDQSAPSLGAFDFDINFDPSILSFNHALINEGEHQSKLDVLGQGTINSVIQTSLGTVNLFELSLATEADLITFQPENFILAIIFFDVLDMDLIALDFTVYSFADASGNTLEINTESVSVGFAVPIPPALLMFISSIIVLLKIQIKQQLSV